MRFFQRLSVLPLLMVLACGTVTIREAPLPAAVETAPEKIEERVDALMDAVGLDRLLPRLHRNLEEILTQAARNSVMDPATSEAYRRGMLEHLGPSTAKAMIRQRLVADLAAAEIQFLLQWLRTPLGQRMVDLEIESLSETSTEAMEAFTRDIRNLQVSDARMELLRRLDLALGATEYRIRLMQLFETISATLLAGDAPEFLAEAKARIAAKFDRDKAQMAQEVASRSLVENIYTYRELDDRELAAYVAFLDSSPAWSFSRSLQDTLVALMEECLAVAQATLAKREEEWMVYEDLNFRFRPPGRPWLAVDARKINPQATLCLARPRPQLFFIVIAEKLGEGYLPDANALVEISQAILKGAHASVTFAPARARSINGLSGAMYESRLTAGNGMRFIHISWCSLHNGYAYQLIAVGRAEHPDEVRRAFDELAPGFALIDPDRAFRGEAGPFGAFCSPHYPYRLDLSGTGWREWPDCHDSLGEAEIGGYNGGAHFMVVPVHYPGMRPSLEALTAILKNLTSLDLDRHPPTAYRQFSEDAVTGCEFSLQMEADQQEFWYRIRVLSAPQNGYLIIVWSFDPEKTDTLAAEVFGGFHLTGEGAFAGGFDRLPETHRQAQASLMNALGRYYGDVRQYSHALPYFTTAADLMPRNPVYVDQVVRMHAQLGHIETGLTALETYLPHHRDNTHILSWRAWLLKELGRTGEALALYEAIFAKGHRHQEDFSDYVRLLCDAGRWRDAEQAVDRLLAEADTLRVRLEKADIYHRQERHQDAVRLLTGLKAQHPLEPEILFRLIQCYRAMERHHEVIALAQELIAKGIYPADAYYYRGEAEYHLKWYRRAKASLEQAGTFDTENEDLSDFIRHVSSLLGEGNNSAVKHPIAPVPLPAALADRLPESASLDAPPGYGAAYAHEIVGLAFDKGGEEKRTTYLRIEILDHTGVLQFSTLEIHFNPVHEELFVNELVVHDAKGEEVSRGSVDDCFIVDRRDSGMATFEQTLNLPIPNLKPGHVIDLVYTLRQHGRAEKAGFFSHCFAGRRPVGLSALFFRGDPRAVRYAGALAPPAEPCAEGLMWVMLRPPVYVWEPSQVPWDAFLPVVAIGSAADTWSGIAAEYLELIRDKLAPADAVAGLAADLTRGVTGPGEQISRIVTHVQQNYAYKAIEFGARGQIPQSAAETMDKGYGDCKDLAILTCQLLNAAGIDAHPALVNTDEAVYPELPSRDQFNHMIVYLPGGEGRFLDPTDQGLDPGVTVPRGLAGKKALVLQQGVGGLAAIPAYAAGDSALTVESRIRAATPEAVELSDTVVLEGYAAAFMRDYLRSMDAVTRKEWGRKLLCQYLPAAQLTDLSVEGLRDTTRALQVSMRYQAQGAWHQTGPHLSFRLPAVWPEYYLRVEPVPDRKTGFMIDFPLVLETRTVVELPADILLEDGGAGEGGEESPFGEWRQETPTPPANGFSRRFSCRLEAGRFPPEEYDAYQRFIDGGLDAARPSLTCRRAGPDVP